MIPKDVKDIISKIERAGYEAFIVGGAVRDYVLGKEPHDWDITTNALPKQTKSIFGKTIDTGLQHGTVTVMKNHVGYEITTYRIDGEYSDGRHPDSVQFTANLKEDLARRDFTINALAMDKDGHVIDYYSGVQDLDNKIIKAVGNPDQRFAEDALRMLRAIRFSAKLGFDIEDKTMESIRQNCHRIKNVSQERITAELDKIMESPHPEKIILFKTTGLAQYCFPEFARINTNELEKLGKAAQTIPASNKNARWALFMQEIDKSVDCAKIMRRLKFPNNKTDNIARMVKDNQICFKDMAQVRKYTAARTPEFLVDFEFFKQSLPEQFGYKKKVFEAIEQVSKDGTAIGIKDLAVNGYDLMELGFKGKEIKDELDRLYNMVLEDPSQNKKDILLSNTMEQILNSQEIERS